MSTRDLERELATVLHRRAEDAMNSTNTPLEQDRFLDTVEGRVPRPGRSRWAIAVAVAAAVAAAAAVTVWSAGLRDDPTPEPAGPVSERSTDVAAAQDFLEAFAAGDVEEAKTYLAPGTRPWPNWRTELERNVAWDVAYLLGRCRGTFEGSNGTVVECPFDQHVLHSDELGEGPFTGNTFSIFVQDGKVVRAENASPYETNGQAKYLEAALAWIGQRHPDDRAFLFQEEGDVPRADWARWLRKWETYGQEYADAMTSGNGS